MSRGIFGSPSATWRLCCICGTSWRSWKIQLLLVGRLSLLGKLQGHNATISLWFFWRSWRPCIFPTEHGNVDASRIPFVVCMSLAFEWSMIYPLMLVIYTLFLLQICKLGSLLPIFFAEKHLKQNKSVSWKEHWTAASPSYPPYPIWRFPEIGVPPVIIHFNRIFHNHPFGVPLCMETTIYCRVSFLVAVPSDRISQGDLEVLQNGHRICHLGS